MLSSNPSIKKAREILIQGGLVAIPTETVYGLAANAFNTEAVNKIFEVKKRPYTSPLIVHATNIKQVRSSIAHLSPEFQKLAQAFWPGPLTLLLPKLQQIPSIVTAGMSRVGVRIPAHSHTQTLLAALPFPLAAPSANPFGYISSTTAHHVKKQYPKEIDYILDGGPTYYGLESTIVGMYKNKPHIYRLGSITQEKIESILGCSVPYKSNSPGALKSQNAPGQCASHYAPKKKLFIGIPRKFKNQEVKNIGILTFNDFVKEIPLQNQFLLAPNGTLQEAAKRLFSGLHYLDQCPITHIFANYLPNSGLGKTINDRLSRAAHNPKN